LETAATGSDVGSLRLIQSIRTISYYLRHGIGAFGSVSAPPCGVEWEGCVGEKSIDLPSRFPVGTRYVIEGNAGRISSRYIEFPDGRKINLPADLAARMKSDAARRRRKPAR
jgi:hypothetical protein